MTHSEQFDQIAKALCEVQRELRPAKRNATNPNGRAYNYSDLASVWEACRKALSRNHIAVFQGVTSGQVDGIFQVDVWTRIVHYPSSQWTAMTLAIPTLTDAKSIGSAITYGRRYSLATLVGVVAESEDDDGNAAVGARSNVPGAMETTTVRVLEVLKETKRKFKPYWRFKASDGQIYGTASEDDAKFMSKVYEYGHTVEVTWLQVWETREIRNLSTVVNPPAEPAL